MENRRINKVPREGRFSRIGGNPICALPRTPRVRSFRGANVKGLFSKIEANARRRLPLPPGRKPAGELARYRAFLKEESAAGFSIGAGPGARDPARHGPR